jgi:Flp pilus assembly protein TadG
LGIYKNREGATAIEFAFMFPIFLLFTFAIIEISLMRFGNAVIDNVVGQAARKSLVGCHHDEYSGGTCLEAFRVDMREVRRLIVEKSVGFVQACDASKFKITVDRLENISPENPMSGVVNLGEAEQIMMFYVTYDWPVFSPFFTLIGQSRKVSQYSSAVLVRNEPFGTIPGRAEGGGGGC